MRRQAITLSIICLFTATEARAQTAQTRSSAKTAPEHARIHRPQEQNNSSEQHSEISKTQDRNGTNNQSAQDLFDRGLKFSRRGLYNEAIEFFTRATNADQNFVEAYNRRARAEWQLEKNKEALEDANWAIKLNPDYAEAFCTRAAIYNSTGRYHEAVADASMARELNPLLGDAYIIEAAAYRSLNQFTEADAAIAKLKTIADPLGAFEEWHPNIDYTPYFSYIQTTVQQNWHPSGSASTPAVPIFKIHRSGQISDLRLNGTTGDSYADNAALDAVKRAAPFRQPPAGSPPDFTVYVVLDSPRPTRNQQPDAPNTANNAQPAAQQTPRAGAVNWSGAVNTGINQGLNLMQRFLPR